MASNGSRPGLQREREELSAKLAQASAAGSGEIAALRQQHDAILAERDKALSDVSRIRKGYKEQIEDLGEQLRSLFAERDQALTQLSQTAGEQPLPATASDNDEALQRALKELEEAKRAQNAQTENFARELSALVMERDAALGKITNAGEAARQEVESLKRERDELVRDRDEMLRLPKIRPISMPPPHLSRENP